MAVLSTDDFNRGDGGLGANWTTVTGFDNPTIVSQIVEPSVVNTGNAAIRTAESYPNDQYAKLRVVSLSSVTRAIGISLRGTTTEHTQYDCLAIGPFGTTTELSIRRYNAGTMTQLATTGATVTLASNDTVEARIVGTVISMYINGSGSPTLSYDDSAAPIESGKPGLQVFLLSGPNSDSRVDDWEAGDFGTPITGLGRKFILRPQ